MAKTEMAWRCSQCGTVNEPGARSCRGCGKWPSLFDLQNSVDEAPAAEQDFEELELEPEPFDPDVFDPETFQAETFEPQTHETGLPEQPETFEPDVEDGDEDVEESNSRRLRRWAISAIWVIGIVVWFVANVLGDR